MNPEGVNVSNESLILRITLWKTLKTLWIPVVARGLITIRRMKPNVNILNEKVFPKLNGTSIAGFTYSTHTIFDMLGYGQHSRANNYFFDELKN